MQNSNTLEKGFYYHYKRNQALDHFNYVYEVLGTALHTETGAVTVIYRPLYTSDYSKGNDFYSRPIEMFLGHVDTGSARMQRFTKIEDPVWIETLEKVL
jgi:hypothetical protein